MYVIRPVPKRYAWGSYTRLQSLFSDEPALAAADTGNPATGAADTANSPLAEMWFSGHPQSPSQLIAPDGTHTTVLDAIL